SGAQPVGVVRKPPRLPLEVPREIAKAAEDATKNVRETAKLQIQASADETKRLLAKAVAEAAGAAARRAAGAQMWKWTGACVVASTICLAGVGWFEFRKGEQTGYAHGWAKADEVGRISAAAASWANTPEGQLAYGLAQAGSVRELAECSGRGWTAKDGVCLVQPEKGKTHGWRLAAAGQKGR
ncbi:MAG: hypothetical protein ABJA82_06815, partial [Myxococcales bacterium]